MYKYRKSSKTDLWNASSVTFEVHIKSTHFQLTFWFLIKKIHYCWGIRNQYKFVFFYPVCITWNRYHWTCWPKWCAISNLHSVKSQNSVYLQLQTQALILRSPHDTTHSREMRIRAMMSELWYSDVFLDFQIATEDLYLYLMNVMAHAKHQFQFP